MRTFHFKKLLGCPAPTQRILAEFIAITADCQLRERFARQGIASREPMAQHPVHGYDMESRPELDRVLYYFASLNWNSEQELRSLRPIIAHHLQFTEINIKARLLVEQLMESGLIS